MCKEMDELMDEIYELGEKNGEARGEARGRAAGLAEGLAEGALNAKKESAFSLAARGDSPSTIATIVNVSLSLVQEWLEGGMVPAK